MPGLVAWGRTARTEVRFGPAARFYFYRIYGLHWMLNVVRGDIGDAPAVLIRGLDQSAALVAWQLYFRSITKSP